MGEVAGLKMPTMDAMNPPIKPTSSKGPPRSDIFGGLSIPAAQEKLVLGQLRKKFGSGEPLNFDRTTISPRLSFHSRSRPFKAVGKNQTETRTRKLDQILSTEHPHAGS